MWRTPCGYSPPTLSQKPPLRRRKYQQTGNGIPPTQRQWRKRNHGSLKPKPPKIERYLKVFHPRNNISAQAIHPAVLHLPKIFTGPPFLFRSPEPLFLLLAKEKAVLAPARQAKTNKTEKASLSAEGKSRFVKFLCRADKISAPTKVRWLVKKPFPARGYAPSSYLGRSHTTPRRSTIPFPSSTASTYL